MTVDGELQPIDALLGSGHAIPAVVEQHAQSAIGNAGARTFQAGIRCAGADGPTLASRSIDRRAQ